MRVLITGAAGFIGSHLCDRFIDESHHVIGVDNFVTGNRDNIVHLLGHDHFEFVEHSTAYFLYVKEKLDGILHLAEPPWRRNPTEQPLDSITETMLSAYRTLELARLKGARYLLASSALVYGNPGGSPIPESYPGLVDPVSPQGIHAEAKRFSESLLAAFHTYYGVDRRIARIFNVYGPRMRAEGGGAIANFVVQALRGEPLTIYGDGAQVRSFCYVDDIVEGIYRLFFSDHVEPVNLGSAETLTIDELAHLILDEVGSQSLLAHLPAPPGDVRQKVPDITRAREVLGWIPRVSLQAGLERTIPYLSAMAERGATPQTPNNITGFL